MVKTLYLLRHGDTGADGRLIGSTDLPITDKGADQLYGCGQKLGEQGITSLVTSPLRRCQQTVETLDLGIAPVILEDLREIEFGDWEGLRFAEIAERWPDEVKAWAAWSGDFTFPGGESIGEFLTRLARVQQALARLDDEKVLVVAHGGVIRHLLCLYLGIEPRNYLLFDVRYGHYATLALHSEGGILTSLNCG